MTVTDYDIRETGITVWADADEGNAKAEFKAAWLMQSYAEANGWFYDAEKLLIFCPKEKTQTCKSYSFIEFVVYLQNGVSITEKEIQSMVNTFQWDVDWDITENWPAQSLEDEARQDYLNSVL